MLTSDFSSYLFILFCEITNYFYRNLIDLPAEMNILSHTKTHDIILGQFIFYTIGTKIN